MSASGVAEPYPHAPKVFETGPRRPHAPWATAAALAYWMGWAAKEYRFPDRGGASEIFYHLSAVALPLAAWRIDLALGARRGDLRPLHHPLRTALAAFGGSFVLPALTLVAIVGLNLDRGYPPIYLVALLNVGVGALVGARLGARGAHRRVATLGCDALSVGDDVTGRRVRYRDIVAVRSDPDHVWIDRRGLPPLEIRLRGTRLDADTLRGAIEERARAACEPAPLSALLRRAGRDVAAWRDDLSTEGPVGGVFREAAPDVRALSSTLMHPGASDDVRVGAAFALRASGDEGLREVRAIADAMLDPALRSALRAIGRGTEDEGHIDVLTRARGKAARGAS